MTKILLQLLSVIILLVPIACQKEMMQTDINSDVPVVEAFLTPCVKPQVSITNLLPFSEEYLEPEPISGLEVIVANQGYSYYLEESSSGVYSDADDSLIITATEVYELVFVYNSDTISAVSAVPDKPENLGISNTIIEVERVEEGDFGFSSFETVEISWDNPDESYHLIVIECIETELDLINANMQDKDLPTQTTMDPAVVPGYNLNMKTLYYFGSYRIVLFKINQEYANLYESVSQSSNSLANPLTNINNGWGIFTGMNSDTLYFEVKEI